MKKRKSRDRERSEELTTERLRDIWEKIRSDPSACRALEQLDEAGFQISHLRPRDASFKHPNWADYIAALPLLPNAPTTRRIHSKASVRKYWPLVRELRRFAAKVNEPFVEVAVISRRDYPLAALRTFKEDLLKAASMVEHFLSLDYYARNVNPRNAVIAELRWTIREKTGAPHDREFNVLIDAAFRAAGHKEGCYIDPSALDRIEKRQRESRVKANQRVRRLISAPSSPLPHSTRIRRKPRKRVQSHLA
jgi:hypothetical protein